MTQRVRTGGAMRTLMFWLQVCLHQNQTMQWLTASEITSWNNSSPFCWLNPVVWHLAPEVSCELLGYIGVVFLATCWMWCCAMFFTENSRLQLLETMYGATLATLHGHLIHCWWKWLMLLLWLCLCKCGDTVRANMKARYWDASRLLENHINYLPTIFSCISTKPGRMKLLGCCMFNSHWPCTYLYSPFLCVLLFAMAQYPHGNH